MKITCLRIEVGMYDRNKTREITRAYREAMDKRMGEVAKENILRGIISGGGVRIKFCNTFERKRQVNITCPK